MNNDTHYYFNISLNIKSIYGVELCDCVTISYWDKVKLVMRPMRSFYNI
jgi:hypothetical protein